MGVMAGSKLAMAINKILQKGSNKFPNKGFGGTS